MKLKRSNLVLIAALFSLSFLRFASGQTIEYPDDVVNEPWINANNVWYEMPLRLRLDKYDLKSFGEFKTRIIDLSDKAYPTQWEGVYHDEQTQLGKTELRLSFGKGFVQYYVYSCLPELRWLSYGTATDSGDTIILSSDFDSNTKAATAASFVKVEWGNLQYLVAESSLGAFLEKAAGTWVEPNNSGEYVAPEWSNYWVRGDSEQALAGMPKLPARFSHLERHPITGLLIEIGRPRRVKEFEFRTGSSVQYINNANIYPTTINKGSIHRVKPGMTFRVGGSGDWMIVRSVAQRTSVGFLIRGLDDENREYCVTDEGMQTKCPQLRTKVNVSTKAGDFRPL